jgi:uncharacterized tellurite resistance protein B-like protein
MEDPFEPRFDGNQLIIETSNEVEIYDAQFLVAALLVHVAKSDGAIAPEETDRMIELINEHFSLRSAQSLELLRRAMTDIAENPDLDGLLHQLGLTLSETDREDIALMMVKVLAADGKATADAMERMRATGELVGISGGIMHRAYDRYFAETMPGD